MDDSGDKSADATRTRARNARFARKSLALALGVLASLAVVEGGFRLWTWIRGEPYDANRSELRLDEFVEQLKGLNFVPKDPVQDGSDSGMSLHPYEGFQTEKTWKRADNPENYFRSQAGRDNFDIVLMGGSVAAGFGNWCRTTLVPILEADPRLAGRTIVIHNRACPAHKQPQLATNLEWAFSLGIEPDAVLLVDGFNELAVAAHNAASGVHPLFPAWMQMQVNLSGPLSNPEELAIVGDIFVVRHSAEQLALSARRFGLMHSAVLGRYVEREFEGLQHRSATLTARLEVLTANRSEERPLFIRGPPFVNEPEEVLRMSVRAWMEGSRSMQAACRARHIQFIHILQPAARDIGSKPLTAKEEQLSIEPALWREAIEKGYPRLREAGAELAREGVNFHDASRIFVDHPEEIYLDACHFEEAGSTLLGAFIARAMLESWPKDQAGK